MLHDLSRLWSRVHLGLSAALSTRHSHSVETTLAMAIFNIPYIALRTIYYVQLLFIYILRTAIAV